MSIVETYQTPRQFLEAAGKILEERELANNLILGVCNNFADQTKAYDGCVFINAFGGIDAFGERKIQATSVKTISKAIVAGTSGDIRYIESLADYYLDNNIDLTGAIGESFYSSEFSKIYGKRQVGEKTLIVHQLTAVRNLPKASGKFEQANAGDVELIAEWTIKFEKEAEIFPVKSGEEVLESTQAKVAAGSVFKWVDKNEIVSIAAVVRQTKNAGIVGLVYTPGNFRGRGYATGCVQTLSEQILRNGFKYCGLFTDQSNPTSNSIYQKIGYSPITEFTDIEYE